MGTNVRGEINQVYTELQTNAKPTIKQSTLYDKCGHVGSIINNNYIKDENNVAKTTIRQQIENTVNIGGMTSQSDTTYIINKEYNAKPTIKQSTLYDTPGGRINNSNFGNYTNEFDARPTTKQTTIYNEYIGNTRGEIDNQISHEAYNNVKLDDRREITTYNHTPNGARDMNGPIIDKENVKLNEPILVSYVSHPHKPLDASVSPTTCGLYTMNKPIIETSSYYINPYFINTLSENPLVNDIYHQKNINF